MGQIFKNFQKLKIELNKKITYICSKPLLRKAFVKPLFYMLVYFLGQFEAHSVKRQTMSDLQSCPDLAQQFPHLDGGQLPVFRPNTGSLPGGPAPGSVTFFLL